MSIKKIFHLFIFFLLHVSLASAQDTKTGKIKKIIPFRPPAVTSYLGRATNNNSVNVDEAKNLLALPLIVSDNKNNKYPISSYQFLFKRKSMVENEKTGQREPSYTSVADRFNSTPLPTLWITNINDGGFIPDEEFYFFDIVVTDKQGRKFFAPNLKIKIK